MKDKALNFLGLMRKANALMVGETDTGAAARGDKAKLVMIAADASDNAFSRAKGFVYGRNIPLVKLPFTKEELSEHLGKNGCSMAAVCDIGFANAFMKDLSAIDEKRYSETAEKIAEAYKRAQERKRESKAHEKNKKLGKRRKNA